MKPVPDDPPAASYLGQGGDGLVPLLHAGGSARPAMAGSGLLTVVGAPAGEHGRVGGVQQARLPTLPVTQGVTMASILAAQA